MAPFGSESLRLTQRISKSIVLSYALDWIILVILGLVAFAFTLTTPRFRPFSLTDLSISLPYHPQTISIAEVALACAVAPAVIVGAFVVFLVPGPATWRRMSAEEIVKLKIWEINVSLLGLALAQVTQFLLTQGMKNLFGKPRPNLLGRCQPDMNNISKYVVSSYASDIAPSWVLVDQRICNQADRAAWVDGFRSFSSGHNSTAFAGMIYLSLFMASKFGVTFPFFASSAQTAPRSSTAPTQNKPASAGDRRTVDDANTHFQSSHHTKAAAAPLWSLVFIFVPIGVAVYIGATRYFDYYHHGFDVLSGSLIGVATGYFGFCWYHGPLGQTRGLAWSPRSRDRAFGVSVGNYGYVVDAESKGKEPVQSEEQGGTIEHFFFDEADTC